jgi:uncharacterized protein
MTYRLQMPYLCRKGTTFGSRVFMANSAISVAVDFAASVCNGGVVHARTRPAKNAFSYSVFFMSLPLSKLAQLQSAPVRGFGLNRRNLVSFYPRDVGPRNSDDATGLVLWVRKLLADADVRGADGEIVLQTFPRVLGYVFNPISIWTCYAKDGTLRAAICEVNNTFGERHNYVVAPLDGAAISADMWLTARKLFHVSPFCDVVGCYKFRFEQSAAHCKTQIDFHDDANAPALIRTTLFGTNTSLIECPKTAVIRAFTAHPLMTFAVVARIHYQAMKLFFKRVPFFSKPTPPDTQTSRSL